MYEKMPVDGNDIFANLTAKELGVGKSKFDSMNRSTRLAVLLFPQLTAEDLAVTDVEFSKMGRAAQLEKLFDTLTAEDLEVSTDEFSKMDRSAKLAMVLAKKGGTLSEFIKDRKPAEKDDPDERIEIQVEFQEDYPNDEAEIKFAKKQVVWLPKIPPDESVEDAIPSVDALVDAETVERVEDVEPRYSRELRDYSYLFLDLYLNRADQQAKIERLETHNADLSRQLEEKKEVGRNFQAEQDRLTRDYKKFEQELVIVERLLKALQTDAKRSQARMELVRNQNIGLAKRLDVAQMRAVEAINRRTPAPPRAGIDATSPKPDRTTAAARP